MPIVYEVVANPYIILCMNFGADWEKGSVNTYPFDDYCRNTFVDDVKKYMKKRKESKESKKPRLPYNLVSFPNRNLTPIIKAVVPREKNQIVIGASGFTRANDSISGGDRSSSFIYRRGHRAVPKVSQYHSSIRINYC